MKEIKSMLVSQPKPENENSPYLELAKKFKIKITFHKFFKIEGVPVKDFRREKVNILDYTAVIFTSRNAVDNFFRMLAELRIAVPETTKYFCLSESTAYYLQKYIIYRKRKIFFGKQNFTDLSDIIKKHRNDKFLIPCSDTPSSEISEFLEENKINHTKATFYKTTPDDLVPILGAKLNYDMLVFFSPIGIKSLFKNYPGFVQKDIKIATFGSTTSRAAKEAKLKVDVFAPTPQAPSMTMALDQFFMQSNKKAFDSVQKKIKAAKKAGKK
ncbi:MAG: uroporphyrinogen-III synthase [Bacteroidales bacterium]|nr:uroporphyrinogen-III synthase [Bacteroidales bacterium]